MTPRVKLALVAAITVLAVCAAPAAADTIHLELSQPTPPRDGQMSGMVSGEASSTGEYVHVGNPNQETECPAEWSTYTKGWVVPNEFGEPTATTPRYSDAFTYWFGGGGGPVLCAYLTSGKSGPTIASTELHVVYGPSKKEAKEAEEAQERERAERIVNEVRGAAEKSTRKEEEVTRKYDEEEATRKYEEEAPAREAAAKKAKEASEQAAINAEDARLQAEYEAAESRAHKRPVTHLSVKAVAQRGNSSQNPGQTELEVMATSFAHVTIKLTRYGHSTYHQDADPNAVDAYDMPTPGQNITPEPIPALSWAGIPIKWMCSRPGGTYRYVVTARSDVGRTLTQRGSFSPVSVARCHELKRHEQEARERSARKYAEEVRQRAREEREVLQREEANCRALRGTPVTLNTSEGEVRVCREPEGFVPLS